MFDDVLEGKQGEMKSLYSECKLLTWVVSVYNPQLWSTTVDRQIIIKYCFRSNYSDRNVEILDRQIMIRNTAQSPMTLI